MSVTSQKVLQESTEYFFKGCGYMSIKLEKIKINFKAISFWLESCVV